MAFMKDIILVSRQAGMFGLVVAFLAPFIDYPIHDSVVALARLGDMEMKH